MSDTGEPKGKMIGISPTVDNPFVPGLLSVQPTAAKQEALGLPIDVPVRVGPPQSTLDFAVAAARLLEKASPGAVPVIYTSIATDQVGPNGMKPRRTAHVDANGKPLYMHIVQ